MSRTPIGEAVKAIQGIAALQDSIGKQDVAIAKIIERLDRLERRLEVLLRPPDR